jgi:subtilisin family serine protease
MNMLHACAAAAFVAVGLAAAVPDDHSMPHGSKLDPAVQAALDSGRAAIPVIVLGARQYLQPPRGFDEFIAKHRTADRLKLRGEVLDELKKIAREDQPRLLRALGVDSALRSLWIVNAVALSLTPEQVRKASGLAEVAFVYPLTEQLRAQTAPSPLSALVEPHEAPRFDPAGKRVAWYLERINAPRVWNELKVEGRGVLISVLDFGTNYAHTDLRHNVWRNQRETPGNGIDDDRNGYIDDVHGYDFAQMRAETRDSLQARGHGTIASGIIVGDGSGGLITGVAPRARIIPMRGPGITAAALAYQYSLDQGADIVSMSFSIPNLGNVRGIWRMISDHAVAAGLVLIGGAGNFQTTAQLPYQHQSPKDVPSVISVGGVDSLSQLVPFSSLGPAEWGTVALYGDHPLPNGLIKPDLVAFPGAGYPLLAPDDSGYIDPNLNRRGNSFAGPQGAGVAALMLSAAPHTPAWRIKELLEQSARDLETPGKDNRTGAGLLDAYASVKAVLEQK